MICLHITAPKDESGFLLEVDRLEREDASPEEARIIDLIHDMLQATFEASGKTVREIKKPWWKRWRG